jgi:hypothetical protein
MKATDNNKPVIEAASAAVPVHQIGGKAASWQMDVHEFQANGCLINGN